MLSLDVKALVCRLQDGHDKGVDVLIKEDQRIVHHHHETLAAESSLKHVLIG